MIELTAQELGLLDELLATANSATPSIKVRIGLLHAKVQQALRPQEREAPKPPAPNRAERRREKKAKD